MVEKLPEMTLLWSNDVESEVDSEIGSMSSGETSEFGSKLHSESTDVFEPE